MEHAGHCCHSKPEPGKPLPPLGKKLKIFGAVFIALLGLSFLPALQPLNQSLLSYLGIVWWAVLLGLLVGGIIDYFVPDGFVVRLLGGERKRTLLNAVFAGLLMSACSHGILAIAIQLYKKGASVSGCHYLPAGLPVG